METKPERVPSAESGLAGYVRTVAALIGVPHKGTTCEISDSANAYLAVARRCRAHPGHDLMLLWTERDGWHAALETMPGEEPAVLAYLGEPLVPEPQSVADFAEAIIDGRPAGVPTQPPARAAAEREQLTASLALYALEPEIIW
jgi:hypothetical protein